jgi:PAS domain-containing protein
LADRTILLPSWRDERARYIVSGGLSTEIPLKYKVEWHKNDLLYAPIYHEGRPVAVLTLDSPREQTIPTKVSLRVPTIIHSMLTEVILQSTLTEHYDNFLEIYNSVIAQGTIGIIEFDESGRITVVNDVAEQILTINRIKLIGNNYYKVLSNDLIAKLSPAIQKAAETLKSVNVITEYTDIDQITKAIDIQITPLHILFNYTGMVWSLNYIEKTAIFKTYRTVLDNFKNINSKLSGDYINIQKQLVKLMCDQ